MHDQLRDFGWEIVHRKRPMNPREWNRIWIEKRVLKAIRTKEMIYLKGKKKLIIYLLENPLRCIRMRFSLSSFSHCNPFLLKQNT